MLKRIKSSNAIYFLLAAFLIVLLYIYDNTITVCLFKNITGIPCPGCGFIHAILALLKGNVVASLQYHQLAIPIVLCTVLYFIFYFIKPEFINSLNGKLNNNKKAVFIISILAFVFFYTLKLYLYFI